MDLPALDSAFIFKFDHPILAKMFAHHEGVAEIIQKLQEQEHFSEMVINSSAGLYLAQPTPFGALDLEQCKETFNLLANLGQVLFEAF